MWPGVSLSTPLADIVKTSKGLLKHFDFCRLPQSRQYLSGIYLRIFPLSPLDMTSVIRLLSTFTVHSYCYYLMVQPAR
jgi:hypothetical protein